MKLKRKKYSIIILVLLLIIFFRTYVKAVTPVFTYACSRGVNVYYYIDGGTGNILYQRIRDAAYNWEHTGCGYNPIYLYIKSNSSGTAMDFYNRNNSFWGDTTTLGETYHRNGSGTRIDPNSNNWLYSEIFLNTSTLQNRTNSQQQGTVAHEMGHAFGLAHYNSNPSGSIMCQSITKTVQTIQQEDNDAINNKY